MPRYTVELEEKVVYSIDVDAKNAIEAEDIAKTQWAASEDPFGDYNGQGFGVEAIGVTKLED